ncbi:MAG: hypothetical protein FWC13_06845 [Oscillospiraceae bacterium]|nr:hypothetical protein [Oscillospiraceae bacterium]
MKKKLVALILIVALTFALAATATMTDPAGTESGEAGAKTGRGETIIIPPDQPREPELPEEYTKLGAMNLWFSDLMLHMNLFGSQTTYKNRDKTTDMPVPTGAIITNNNTSLDYLRLGVSITDFVDSDGQIALKGFRIHFDGSANRIVFDGGGDDVSVSLSSSEDNGLEPDQAINRLLLVSQFTESGAFGGSWDVTMEVPNSKISANNVYTAKMTWFVMDTPK